MNESLTAALQALDEKAAAHSTLNNYYAGSQPLTFLAPEIREQLNNRLSRVAVNVPRVLVDAIAERLRVTGMSGVDVWDEWLRNDLDQVAGVVHREALILGESYVIVWADAAGRPKVTVESASQVHAITDPGTRRITSAVKRWEAKDGTHAVWYGPDVIERYHANQPGATTTGFKLVETIDNPLGLPPVVRFRNSGRVLDQGTSEMADVLSLTDGVVKLTTDLLTASEYGARPRRWATGVELVEDDVLDEAGNPTGETTAENPFNEGDRMMISEAPESKFGQLPGSDLAGYESAISVIMRQVSAISGLPDHMLGLGGNNPTSADSIRASEAALTAKAEMKSRQFGKSWEDVARLIVGVRDGVDPLGVTPSTQWADPATRSEAQVADSVVKLHAAGIIPTTFALRRLGYSNDEIEEIRADRQVEAIDRAAAEVLSGGVA